MECAQAIDQRLRATLTDVGVPDVPYCLVALGGYGRGELEPSSDVDIQFTVQARTAEFDAFVEACLHRWWDDGFALGFATRTIEETVALAREDHHTATSLLDVRWVAGDQDLFSQLHHEAWARVLAPRAVPILTDILADRTARHARFGDSVFLLEPDVKSGEGGLRDHHGACWAATLVRGAAELRGLGLSDAEVAELDSAYREVRRFRTALHEVAGRKEDRLYFAHQRGVCRALGADDVPTGMQRFYRAARRVRALSRRVLDACRLELGMPIGAHIPGPEPTTVQEAMALFRDSAERNLPLHPGLLEAAAEVAAEVTGEDRHDPDVAEDFFAVLTGAGPRAQPLAHLHDVGLLSALLPEWACVTGLYQHNVFHVYTVDAHTLHGIGALESLRNAPPEDPRGAVYATLTETERRVLYLALLFHDVGKGGADPGVVGSVAHRLGLSEADCERVVFLVREHLLLALLAQTRDIHDATTWRHLARASVDRRTLAMLYLLTWADMSSANPDLLTAWKASLLDELYRRTDTLLAGGLGLYEDAERVVQRLRAAMLNERLGTVPDHPTAQTREVDAFLERLPTRYAAVTSPDRALAHCEAISSVGPGDVVVQLSVLDDDTAEIVVAGADAPGLLARLSGTLAVHGVDIIGAEVFTRSEGEMLDVFRVLRPVPTEALARDLDAVVRAQWDPHDKLRARERPSPLGVRPAPPVETVVQVDNEASEDFTVLDVTARDRPGLLYRVTRSLHDRGLDIELARASTEGHTARDAFYLRRVGGGKLESAEEIDALESDVRAAIESAL